MSTLGTKIVDLRLFCWHETDAAFQLSREYDATKAWVPKSMVHWTPQDKYSLMIDITMPEWLAYEKGLV